MEKHQRNNSANGKIMTYMEQEYLYPSDFATLLYASQMLQAEAIKMEWSICADTEDAVWEPFTGS